jgi:hypothetical protein
MGESAKHAALVDALVRWIAGNPETKGCIMLRDTVETPLPAKPVSIGGFVPDVFGMSHGSGEAVVIGEAKTESDFDTERSQAQISAFLRFCASRKNAIFALAVPWGISVYAKVSLRRLRADCGAAHVTAFVIDEQGFSSKV